MGSMTMTRVIQTIKAYSNSTDSNDKMDIVSTPPSQTLASTLSPSLPSAPAPGLASIPSDLLLPFNISTILAALSTLADGYSSPAWPDSCEIKDGQSFDIIIVGGGTAGCVLANRLSEVHKWNIAVIEAGGDPPITSVVPGLLFLLPRSAYDWTYYSEDDGYSGRAQQHHQFQLTAGKMLGGSSSLNHMTWARGNKPDFDNWNSSLWSWETALTYLKKAESMKDPTILNSSFSQYHGTDGPILLTGHADKIGFESEEIILSALKELGIAKLVSTNGPDSIGASRFQFTVDDTKPMRQSTAATYLLQASNRSNLCVIKNTLVTKILIGNDKRAVGVQVSRASGDTLALFANLEVIVSAGAFNSPKLLMLSGVGPRSELDKFKIDLKADLPVGQNMQDHVFTPIFITGKNSPAATVVTLAYPQLMGVPSVQRLLTVENPVKNNPAIIEHFLAYFGALSPLLYAFLNIVFNFNTEFSGNVLLSTATRACIFGLVNLEHPLSRGNVTLRSTDPNDAPVVNMGYFTEEKDINTLALGLEEAAKLTQASYFKSVNSEVLKLPLPECDSFEFASHEYWKCYAVKASATNFHFMSTCRIGAPGAGVVDERLRVHGIEGLRVIDASVMPGEITGETYAATVMTAERGADLVKEDYNVL